MRTKFNLGASVLPAAPTNPGHAAAKRPKVEYDEPSAIKQEDDPESNGSRPGPQAERHYTRHRTATPSHPDLNLLDMEIHNSQIAALELV